MAWIVVLAWSLTVKDAEAEADKKKLTLAVFLSGVYTTRGGQAFLTGLEMALELLNNNSSLLPGYTVDASITDVQVQLLVRCTRYACHLFILSPGCMVPRPPQTYSIYMHAENDLFHAFDEL